MRRLLLAGLAAPFPALAADPPADATVGAPVDTITVTAYRTPQPLDRVGSAVTIVGSDGIELRQDAVAAEALRGVPGLAIARGGPVGAQTQVRMRGAEANQLLVLIDGVEANDLATDDSFSFEHLTTFDIERIEVVRGPQSALWGSDALAGVINVVTRRPEQPLETAGFLESGSFGLVNGGARVGLRGDDASLAASVSRLDVDGTNAARTGTEDDGYENTTGNLAAALRVLPSLALDFSLRHTDATTDYDALDFVDGVLVPVDANDHTDVTQDYARAGARLDLLDGRWSHELHYGVTAVDTDTTAEDRYAGGFDHSSTRGDKYGVYYQSTVRLPQRDPAAPADLLTVAVDHEREEFRQRVDSSDYGNPNQDQALETTGYAVEYVAFIGRDLSLSASARRDDNSDFGDVNTMRATASWNLPATRTRLHASFGNGQKSPTFFERFGYAPDTFVGNPNLDPETSRGWDAGVEQALLDGRLVADVTWFLTDLEDEINGYYCPPPDFLCTAVNEDTSSRRRGVETSVRAELGPAWSVSASYTYTDATEGDAREVRRPMHVASVDATGRWLNGRLAFNAGAYYTGQREDDAFLLDAPYVTRVTLGDYTLVNLALSYDVTRQVTVYGRLENALDEDYEDVYGFNTPGIGGFAGVRVRFAR